MPTSVRFITLCTLVVLMQGRSEAESLKVSPARFILHDLKPGVFYDIHKETGLRLTIYNDGDTDRTWALSTHRPSERGRWEKGYGEIPDAKWCWFTEDEITVEPNSQAYAHLNVQIPPGEKYYNQHWVATLNVSGKPGAGGIGVAVDIRVQIETESRADLNIRPDGLLGMRPSTVRFEEVVPGTDREATVTLFNNDDVPHNYSVSSLFEDHEMRRRSYLTRNYSEIPDWTWLARDENIHIEPGGSAELHLRVNVPEDAAHFGRKWEDMVLIQPDEGRAEFVRVRVETPTRPDTLD